MRTQLGGTLALAAVGLLFPLSSLAQPFQGCGTLVQGVECVLFEADADGLYIMATGGMPVGTRLHVTGVIDPTCVSYCQQGDGCLFNTTYAPCPEGPYRSCGTLFQGVECVLFRADSGGEYLLDDNGPFGPGDRVDVSGTLDPFCVTISLQGNGCITGNTIEACAADLYTACGTLVDGVECVLFQTDSGDEYVLDNYGAFHPGDRVDVAGMLDPGCFTTCLEGDGCVRFNAIGPCEPVLYASCGVLFEGVECVLFRADNEDEYVLDDYGPFGPGDRVEVAGTLDPACVTICQQGDGCVHLNAIGPCGVCPCDRDGDGVVNVVDLLVYLSLWFRDDAGAEFDGMGGIDSGDLLAFLACWFPAGGGDCG